MTPAEIATTYLAAFATGDPDAVAACVLARSWTDEHAAEEIVARVEGVAPYEPGRFYLRELPCLEAVLAKVRAPLEAVVVDGHVWLDGDRPGLGARLHEALGARVPVIGVAKNPFRGSTRCVAVLRGTSKVPLWVSAMGMDVAAAAEHVRAMHGPHRIPALLARVDRLARDA